MLLLLILRFTVRSVRWSTERFWSALPSRSSDETFDAGFDLHVLLLLLEDDVVAEQKLGKHGRSCRPRPPKMGKVFALDTVKELVKELFRRHR